MKNFLFLLFIVFPLFALKAGESFVIEATPRGKLIDSTFEVRSKKFLLAQEGRVQLSIVAEGNCRFQRDPWDDVIPPERPGGEPRHGWVCEEQEGIFELPQTVYLKGKYIVYDDGENFFNLAKLKGFLFWEWLEIRKGVSIEIEAPFNQAFVFLKP